MRAAERRLCELQEPAGSVVVRLESAALAAQVAGPAASVAVHDLPSHRRVVTQLALFPPPTIWTLC